VTLLVTTTLVAAARTRPSTTSRQRGRVSRELTTMEEAPNLASNFVTQVRKRTLATKGFKSLYDT
jgi:hypothetical protein